MIEAAAHHAISFVTDLGLTRVILEGESLSIINKVQSKEEDLSMVGSRKPGNPRESKKGNHLFNLPSPPNQEEESQKKGRYKSQRPGWKETSFYLTQVSIQLNVKEFSPYPVSPQQSSLSRIFSS
ncbi:hypothetical protein PTKIN_Ptkin02bG0150700 [Pterospermum kingtungense]